MMRRGICIGTYNTAMRWTLCALSLDPPTQQTSIVNVPGGIPLDMSTALTGGEPSYNSRKLSARLECSDGYWHDRESWIREMVNSLDGYRLEIRLPDDLRHYLMGRVQIKREYNDLAHAAVSVTATCEPWLYCTMERSYRLTAQADRQVVALTNAGRRAVVPTVSVQGDDTASVLLEWGSYSHALGVGDYSIPDLWLRPGDTMLTYSGSGEILITYREAVLQ